MKHKLLTALDRINEQPEMDLFDGVRLVKDPAAADDIIRDPSSARSATADTAEDEDNTNLDTLVVDKVVNFFKSRSIQFRLLDNESRQMADGKSLVSVCLALQYPIDFSPYQSLQNIYFP